VTDDEADRILTALAQEGFSMPYMAHVQDYPEVQELRAADAKAQQQNRDALRRVARSWDSETPR